MRIAHVVAAFPPDIGGMGKVAYDESKELAKRGHDVTVFTLAYPLSHYDDSKIPFKVVRKAPLIPGGYGGFLPSLRHDLANFDLIHLHYPFYGGAEFVWTQKIPYVVTYHMDAEPTLKYQQFVKKFYDKFLAERILQKAKRVILVDKEHVFKMKDKLFPEQIAEIPNGIDTEIFSHKNVDCVKMALDELIGKRIFLFVGNFLPVKGLSLLLEAWKDLPKDAHLLVVGGGYREPEYRKMAENLGVGDRVHWMGACSSERLAEYYSLAEATIVPSFSESFSLVAAEALASACPVIGSDIPGMRARVVENETGLLFKTGSKPDLVKVVDQFLKLDPVKIRQLGVHGRELVEMRFSLKKHVDTLEQVYKNCI